MPDGIVYELLRMLTRDDTETTVYLVRHPIRPLEHQACIKPIVLQPPGQTIGDRTTLPASGDGVGEDENRLAHRAVAHLTERRVTSDAAFA